MNYIDFRRPNGCHRISDKIDVTSLTVQIANDSLADIELVEKILQPTVDAAWSHGLAECQVKHFFPWNDTEFQEHFPHGITMSVLDLKAFSGTVLLEILVQLANLKVRYHRRGPHMRSLISIDFPTPEMEPESAHVVSAVSVP